jgi:hypothetical protein
MEPRCYVALTSTSLLAGGRAGGLTAALRSNGHLAVFFHQAYAYAGRRCHRGEASKHLLNEDSEWLPSKLAVSVVSLPRAIRPLPEEYSSTHRDPVRTDDASDRR